MSESDSPAPDDLRRMLAGSWHNADEHGTDVVIAVTWEEVLVAVKVVDPSDNEEAEVYDVTWDGEVLAFATHWVSNGRLVKYRMRALSENRVDLTYTYSHRELWHRLPDSEKCRW
ncbi:hypothetical protein [Bythopirellula polymerisocia]|uniref:Uncharacterized protein n=1 Tax=Bythopirellula polymerisocia TaxID=2528003 RepID=A0A5C6CZB7_9BACT|nr:hypothetical protein [Bythopirellula polymerisocia]TWU29982.1 hypothetical protein Pla144_07630 [Bythopirellula polymerisocia]